MIGRRYWIWIWWGILAMGVSGFVAALYWGVKTHWRNLDEILRGIGTILVSIGMLMLLYRTGGGVGTTLLLAAGVCFILAFALGRDTKLVDSPHDDPPTDPS
ncbi:MAG TPA: hypothetical protein VGM77_10840 [Gemmatimonadales bacterium]|jgi:ABC-type uncharacterized transport system permease subunit